MYTTVDNMKKALTKELTYLFNDMNLSLTIEIKIFLLIFIINLF